MCNLHENCRCLIPHRQGCWRALQISSSKNPQIVHGSSSRNYESKVKFNYRSQNKHQNASQIRKIRILTLLTKSSRTSKLQSLCIGMSDTFTPKSSTFTSGIQSILKRKCLIFMYKPFQKRSQVTKKSTRGHIFLTGIDEWDFWRTIQGAGGVSRIHRSVSPTNTKREPLRRE